MKIWTFWGFSSLKLSSSYIIAIQSLDVPNFSQFLSGNPQTQESNIISLSGVIEQVIARTESTEHSDQRWLSTAGLYHLSSIGNNLLEWPQYNNSSNNSPPEVVDHEMMGAIHQWSQCFKPEGVVSILIVLCWCVRYRPRPVKACVESLFSKTHRVIQRVGNSFVTHTNLWMSMVVICGMYHLTA